MEYLENWITPLVKEALLQALESRTSIPERILEELDPASGNLGPAIDDGGSNFYVQSRRERFVQLLEWTENLSPLECILSDSYSMIRGIITSEARAAYENDKKNIGGNKKGSIMLIQEFKIVMGQIPTDQPEIHFRIEQMKLVGCEDTGIFGNPKSVITDNVVEELGKLCWKNSEHREPDSSDNDESLGSSSQLSQLPSSRNQAADNDDTQPCLLSQAPPNIAAPKSDIIRELPKISGRNHDRNRLLDVLNSKNTKTVAESNDESFERAQSPSKTTRTSPQKIISNGKIFGSEQNDVSSAGNSSTPARLACSKKRKACPASSDHNPSDSENPGSPVRKLPKKEMRDKSSFNGWSCIRRHDVLIPEDQQNLIDDSDSWVPPATGQRMPYGRVPMNLLQQWDSLSSKPDMEDLLPAPDTHASSYHDSEHRGQRTPTTSILPESGLPSSDWPSSPGRAEDNNVPPDSSPPNVPHRPSQGTTQNLELEGSPLPTPRLDPSTAIGGMSEDSGHDFPMELSGLNGLDTSTQEQHLSAKARTQTQTKPQTQPDSDIPNPDLPATPSNANSFTGVTQPSFQRVDESAAPKNHSSTADPPSTSTRRSSDILVPATCETDNYKPSTQTSTILEQGPTRVNTYSSTQSSSLHDSSSLNHTEPMAAPQTPCDDNIVTSSRADDTMATVSVPRSSLNTGEETIQPPAVSLSKVIPGPPITRKRKSSQPENIHMRPAKLRKAAESKSSGVLNAFAEHRQVFFEESPLFSPTREIFNKFKQAYPSYEGDIWIFRNSCSKLQCLRDQGLMQQSFLWDDFVAREVSEYREYAIDCHNKDISPDRYDVYFETKAKPSRFKKRCLTNKNIEFIATGFAREYKVPLKGSKLETKRPLIVEESPPPAFEEAGIYDLAKGGSISDDDQSEYEFYDAHETASEILGSEDDRPMPRVKSAEGRKYKGDTDHGHTQPTMRISAKLVARSRKRNKRNRIAVHFKDNLDPISESENETVSHPAEVIEKKSPRRQRLPMYPPNAPTETRRSDTSPPSPPSPWWKQQNTPFKSFAKNYVNLFSELGHRRKNPVDQVVPVDEDGVIKVEQPERQTQGGKMNSMGFKCPWA